jgi:hypothetical protein
MSMTQDYAGKNIDSVIGTHCSRLLVRDVDHADGHAQITRICAHHGQRHHAESAAPNGGYSRA